MRRALFFFLRRRDSPVAAILAFGALVACGTHRGAPIRPNVLLLDIDTLRADHLGCYGYSRATSPRIDGLAAMAHRFAWAFAQAPYTPPSQTSLLTGLYVSRHGVRTAKDRLPDAVETMAERFERAGYRTAAFVDGGFMSRGFGLSQGFGEYDDEGGGLAKLGPKLLSWLGAHRDEPFLALLHSYDVHSPYAPDASYRALFLAGLEPPSADFEPTVERLERARLSMWTDSPEPLAGRDVRFAEALYDAEIRYVDGWIGTILDRLDELDLARSTIIVLVSDHGEEFGEHGSVLHEKPYATVTRIPLLIRLPGQTVGTTHEGVVQGVDLAPTLVELGDLEPMPDRDGRSLASLLRGGTAPPGFAFGENPWIPPGQYLVIRDRHLLHHPATSRLELYDFRADPLQRSDLSVAEADRLRSLAEQLSAFVERLERRRAQADRVDLDAGAEHQLRALGYL